MRPNVSFSVSSLSDCSILLDSRRWGLCPFCTSFICVLFLFMDQKRLWQATFLVLFSPIPLSFIYFPSDFSNFFNCSPSRLFQFALLLTWVCFHIVALLQPIALNLFLGSLCCSLSETHNEDVMLLHENKSVQYKPQKSRHK